MADGWYTPYQASGNVFESHGEASLQFVQWLCPHQGHPWAADFAFGTQVPRATHDREPNLTFKMWSHPRPQGHPL